MAPSRSPPRRRTSNDDEVLRAENAAVRASLKSEDGSEALHRTICLAWLDASPTLNRRPRAAGATVGGVGGLGLRPHERRLPALLLHAVAGAPPRRRSPGPDDVQDPDRAVVTVGSPASLFTTHAPGLR